MAVEVMTAPEGRIIHKTYAVLSGAAIPQRVHVTQYDESLPVIACTLYKDGQLYTIPDGASVRLRMNKNGLPVYHEAIGIDDARHVVYLEITAQMTVLYGEFAMVVEVETSDGKTAGTSYLRLIVRQNPVQNPELDNIPDYTANSNRLTAEGVKKLQDESSTQQKAIEDKGKNTLESIPADYSTLSGMVNENTSGISELKEDLETLNQGGLNLKEDFIDQQVNEWLDKHPEATTTVQDYSLTVDKMVIGTLGYVTPEMFGAVGDGKTDDTGAIQKAIDSVKNGYVLFQRSTYCVSKELQITNKNIIFNNCILKRISNCTVLNFDNSNNFKLSDVTITDNGSTYGNMIVGRGCENVEIKNVTVNSSSQHTNESIGNWATCLSGNAFHISGLRINNYESGLWADGLHFGYVTNSVIEDFVILSGDDSIAITQHELGGTRFENKVSENIKFVNGVVKSAKASPFRLGFDNAGKRSENEIDKCYHKNILFENIECEGGYFLRVEYISHDSGVLPISDENIKFANISYKQDRIVTNYPPFFVSKEYSLVNYSFNNCNIDCSFATEEMTQPFSYIASNIENEKSLLTFSDCLFNFGNIGGIVGYKINKVKFKNCNFLSNGKKIISIYGSCEFVESDIINYGEEANYFCIINASDNDKTYRLNGCFISNYKQFSNKNEDNHTFLFMDNCYFKTTVNVLSWYGGNVNYNNIIKGDRKLNSSKDIFLYVPANLSIKYDLSSYAYASLLVLSDTIETYEIIITSGGHIMLPESKRKDAINMLKSAGLTISVENRILTINNIEDVYKNVFIKCYAQTN